jgi:hypothetical protein
MRAMPIFVALAVLMLGIFLLVDAPGDTPIAPHEAFMVVGVLMVAGAITYFWKRTGFRGLKPK